MTPSIEFKGVSKFFGNIIALKDISFKVFKGEITALLGDNGAGKSTLIKLLSGVHIPSEGEILLNGKVVILSHLDKLLLLELVPSIKTWPCNL